MRERDDEKVRDGEEGTGIVGCHNMAAVQK